MGVTLRMMCVLIVFVFLIPISQAEESLPAEPLPDSALITGESQDVATQGMTSEADNQQETFDQAVAPDQNLPPAELIAPPRNVQALDFEGDDGTSVQIRWDPSTTEGITSYEIAMKDAEDPAAELVRVIRLRASTMEYRDSDMEKSRIVSGHRYRYYIRAFKNDVGSEYSESQIVIPDSEWFKFEPYMIQVAVWTLIICIAFTYYIFRGKTGADFYIRPIAGLENVDEAIGRATEMGRPIIYVLGIGYIEYLSTIASLTILGRVAKKAAEYDTPILVPCFDYIVFPIAQEIVKTSFSDAGRPDAYKADSVYYVTSSQFAYVSNVCGTMQRERPATNFFMGYFKAESLILAETGAATGAIQIAGTDCDDQLPFFITACDYTLIGEELYAASAYLAHEPVLLGTLKGQDFGKAMILLSLIIGAILMLFNQTFFLDWFPTE